MTPRLNRAAPAGQIAVWSVNPYDGTAFRHRVYKNREEALSVVKDHNDRARFGDPYFEAYDDAGKFIPVRGFV